MPAIMWEYRHGLQTWTAWTQTGVLRRERQRQQTGEADLDPDLQEATLERAKEWRPLSHEVLPACDAILNAFTMGQQRPQLRRIQMLL